MIDASEIAFESTEALRAKFALNSLVGFMNGVSLNCSLCDNAKSACAGFRAQVLFVARMR